MTIRHDEESLFCIIAMDKKTTPARVVFLYPVSVN